MASADLKDVFYSIPIKIEHQKYFEFYWNQFFKYTGMPNGYSEAMHIFIKILKPSFAKLRSQCISL